MKLAALLFAVWFGLVAGGIAFVVVKSAASGLVVFGLALFFSVAVASALPSSAQALEDSADISNAAFEIRSAFGREAQMDFLNAVSAPTGQNSNERKFLPGHDRRTMLAEWERIRRTYPPLEMR